MKSILKSIVIILIGIINYSKLYCQNTNDTLYNYTYQCNNCGNFKTYSTLDVELQTQVNVISELLVDTGINTLAQFSYSSNQRNLNNSSSSSKLLFQIYPNPSKGEIYLYINAPHSDLIIFTITDLLGRINYQENIATVKGINIFERKLGLNNGSYLINIITKNKIEYNKNLIIVK